MLVLVYINSHAYDWREFWSTFNMSIVRSLYSPFILSATHWDVYMGKVEGRANIAVVVPSIAYLPTQAKP